MDQFPTFEEIRSSILRDTLSLDPNADTHEGSDHFVHASRLASCAEGQYAHQAWILRQFFADTADTQYLERHCNLRGLRRKNATFASGTATVYGVANANIPAGLQIKSGSLFFTTTTAAKIAVNGNVSIKLAAVEAGITHNLREVSAQFMAAPSGVTTDLVINLTVGGTDAESDASLLSRYLELIRRPPAGGNKYDYRNWALSVDGVTSAYIYPLRRGLGTVDIVITSAGGIPSDEIVTATQDYIDSVRPVTAKHSLVIKPNVTRVNITVAVKLLDADLNSAKTNIQAALTEYFSSIKPGDSVVLSQLEAVISNVAGVVDRKMTTPAANLVPDMVNEVEWFMLGVLTVTVLP